jgi:hypothetical protein
MVWPKSKTPEFLKIMSLVLLPGNADVNVVSFTPMREEATAEYRPLYI